MYALDVKMVFQGKIAGRVDKALRRGYKSYSGDVYMSIQRAIKNIADQEDDVFKMIDDTFNNKIVKSVMDYQALNVLKYVEALNYFNEYSRNLLQVIVLEEFDKDAQRIFTTPIDRAAVQWIEEPGSLEDFIKVVNVLTMPVKDFLKGLRALEGITFNPESHASVAAANGRKLDPHAMGFLPPNMNPIYHVGLAYNNYLVTKNERNKEELAKIQLTVMALKQQQQGDLDEKSAEKIAKQVKYHSNRANKLAAKIEDMEEED